MSEHLLEYLELLELLVAGLMTTPDNSFLFPLCWTMDPDNVAGLDPDTNFIADIWFLKFMQKPGFIIRLSGWDLEILPIHWDLADWAIISQESVLPFYL